MKTRPHHSLAAIAAALLLLLTAPKTASAKTLTAIAQGNWSDPDIWDNPPPPPAPTAPGGDDTAVIDMQTVTLNTGGLEVQRFIFVGGNLIGDFGLRIIESFIWTSGTFNNAGITIIEGTASINDTQGFSLFLGGVLQNAGTITFSSADASGTEVFNGIHFGAIFGSFETGPGVINNTGNFNVTAGGDFELAVTNTGHAINNSGSWNVSGVGVTSKVTGVAFNNTGNVDITNGTLLLAGGGTSTGTFSVGSGAALTLSEGTHHLNAASVVSGAGFVEVTNAISIGSLFTVVNVAGTFTTPLRVSGGTVNFQAVATPPSISLSSGTLSGGGLVSATGNLTWTGGMMSGAGTTSVAGPASTIHHTAGSPFGDVILGRLLANTGTIVFSNDDTSTGIIFGADAVTPGVINNAAGATFNVTAGGDFSPDFNNPSNAGHAINNSGTWNVSGAGTTSTVESGIAFHNKITGTVNVLSGILDLRGSDGGSTFGDYAISAGAGLLVESDFSFAADSNLTGPGSVTFASGTSRLNGGGHTIAEVNVTGGLLDLRASQTFNELNIGDGTVVLLTSISPALLPDEGALLNAERAMEVPSVPEPTSAVLLALSGCWMMNLRRKRSMSCGKNCRIAHVTISERRRITGQMKFISRIACALATFFAAHFSSYAAVTVFQDDLPGFISTAGPLPIMDFDGIVTTTDLAGTTIQGITFTSPFGNTLDLVRAASTFTDAGFIPAGDSDNRLFATTHAHVISPGGATLVPGPDLREQDGLCLVFATPVQSFGIDVLFQSLDGASGASFELRDSAGTVIASGTLNIPAGGPGSDPTSSSDRGGIFFIGFHSDQADIARIDFIEPDMNEENPDANLGYDTIRTGEVCAQSGKYTFTPVVGGYLDVSLGRHPAIDNSGTVVFIRDAENAGGLLARPTTGGQEVLIADRAGGFYDFRYYPAVSRTGLVAFTAQRFGPNQTLINGVYSSSTAGTPIVTVADDTGPLSIFGIPAVNNAGTVVFQADLDSAQSPAPRGIFSGATPLLVDTDPTFGFTNVDFQYGLDINEAGTVAFLATLDAGPQGSSGGTASDGVFCRLPGGQITTVADNTNIGGFHYFQENPAINSSGTVAFTGLTDLGVSGVFTGSCAGGQTPVLVADTRNGNYYYFYEIAINDAGTVAFLALLEGNALGIFTGPDLLRDRVIAIGDPLFCSTVTDVHFSREGLNDRGQIAFFYQLADNRFGIAVATPRDILRIRSITRLVPGTTRLDVLGFAGLIHTIHASPDLIQPFVPIGTRTAAADGTFQFDDMTALSKRFYRVTLP